MEDLPPDSQEEESLPLVGFLKKNPYVSFIGGVSMVGGVIYANLYFSELSTLEATMGGILFGLVCTAFSVSYRLFEME